SGFGRIGGGDVHADLRDVVAVLVGNAGRPEVESVFLHHAAYGWQVVIRRLHGPDIVTVRAECLRRVAFHSGVDDDWIAIDKDQEIAGVVVAVAASVHSAFRAEVKAFRGA